MSDQPITCDEMAELFGAEMPIEAATLIYDAPRHNLTLGEVRDKLIEMAEQKRNVLSAGSHLLLELFSRHHQAARDNNEHLRARYFDIIEDFEWAFPDIAKEVHDTFPGKSGEQ